MAQFAMPADIRVGPTRIERQERLLRALRDLAADREALKRNENELVLWCRDEGLNWTEIGEALGLSPQGARAAALRRATR